MPDWAATILLRLLDHYRSLSLSDYLLIAVSALILGAIIGIVIHRLYSIGFSVRGAALSDYAELSRDLHQDRQRLKEALGELETAQQKVFKELEALQSQHTETKASAEILAHNVYMLSRTYVGLYAYAAQTYFLVHVCLLLTNYVGMGTERRHKDAPRSVETWRQIGEYHLAGISQLIAFGYFITGSLRNASSTKIEKGVEVADSVPKGAPRRLLATIEKMYTYMDKDEAPKK